MKFFDAILPGLVKKPDEPFDILNASGNPTGEVTIRGAVLNDGEYYLGTHAYIYNASREFLLQRRALTKSFHPGEWDITMGHAIAGETSVACMQREIEEETGICVPEGSIRHIARIPWPAEHHFIDVYFVQIEFDLDELLGDPLEVIGFRVVPRYEMASFVKSLDFRPAEYRAAVLQTIERV